MTKTAPPRNSNPARCSVGASPRTAVWLRRTVFVAVFSVAGLAIGGHYCALRSAARKASVSRMFTSARLGAAEVGRFVDERAMRNHAGIAGRPVPLDDQLVEAFKQWSVAVMKEVGASATVLVDAGGTVLLTWPASLKLSGALPIRRGARAAYLTEGNPLKSRPGFTAVFAPVERSGQLLPLVQLAVVGEVTVGGIESSKPFLIYVGVILLSSLFVSVAASVCLRRKVYLPLRRLRSHLERALTNGAVTGDFEPDTLEGLTCSVQALCTDLARSQDKVRHLEDSVTDMVERRTQQISGQLRRAEKVADIDPLTGLTNRRFIEENLEPLFEEQTDRHVSLAIAAFDVDNFKPLNDSRGHAAGDAVLRFIGELLKGSLRENDVAVRIGGDEFVVLLVDVTWEDAVAITQRIVQLFAQRLKAVESPQPVTLSAGLASTTKGAYKSGAELLAAADQALYDAKRDGKNMLCASAK